MNRKHFIRNSSLAATALATNSFGSLFSKPVAEKVKLAIIGVGLRGQDHLDLLLRRDDVEVIAICDIDNRSLTSAKELITKTGKKMPQIFTGDINSWKNLIVLKGLDAVVIATPWEAHKSMIIGSLEAGIKYVYWFQFNSVPHAHSS